MFPFIRGGYRHSLLKRDGDVCLVERRNLETDSVHYEIVCLRRRPARIGPRGTLLPATTVYPSSARWGHAGRTYTSRADADRRWECLVLRTRPPPAATQRPGGRVGVHPPLGGGVLGAGCPERSCRPNRVNGIVHETR
jgi:hypothetical protein